MAEAAAEAPHELSAPAGFDRVWPLVEPIEGWLSREQAAALYAAAGTVKPGYWIVELGSHHGRSTVALAKGRREAAGVLAVDPFPSPGEAGRGEAAYRAFLANLRRTGVESEVTLFPGTSAAAAEVFEILTEAAGEPSRGAGIGLLFVDALHDRSSVLGDIASWEPRVAEGGLVCFHDAFFRLGVTLALLQRHLMSSEFRYLGSVGNLAIFRRQFAGTRPALLDSLRLLARLGYFARNLIVTLAVRRNWRWLQRLVPPEKDFEY